MQRFGWTALAAGLVLAWTANSQAQDTIRLGSSGDAKVQTLVFDGQAETEQVYLRWGYRPFVGGFRPFYRPFAYRPFAYRPYLGYRSFYGYRGYGYGGYGYGAYASYYTPYYSYPQDYSYYVNPCGGDVPSMPSATVLGSSSYARGPIFPTPNYQSNQPLPSSPQNGNATFDYDGGPGQPMPLPGQDGPAPTFQPKRPTVPLDGKLVSIPGQPTKYSYPAYGEMPVLPPARAQAAPVRVVSNPAGNTVRISYPAYGDR